MIGLLITLVVYGLILAIIWWGVSQIPVPAPFSWVIKAVFALVVVVVLLQLILPLANTGGEFSLPRFR